MKTVDNSDETETPAKVPDRPAGGGVVPPPTVNETHTDIGDPLSDQYNKGDLHNAPSHVTGTGGGPAFRSHRRSFRGGGFILQDYAKMAAEHGPRIANLPKPEPRSGRDILFDETGQGRNFLPFEAKDWGLPETQPHRTFPYEWARKGSLALLHNPLTRMANQGPWQGALAGAAAFGLPAMAALGLHNAWRGLRGEEKKKLPFWRSALLAGLAGAGLGAWSGHLRHNNPGNPHSPKFNPNAPPVFNFKQPEIFGGRLPENWFSKESSARGSDVGAIVQSLRGADVPAAVLERIIQSLTRMHPSDVRALRTVTGMMGGTALAVFLARRLGLGSLLTAGLGLAGALHGGSFLGRELPRRQRMTDFYGNPYN